MKPSTVITATLTLILLAFCARDSGAETPNAKDGMPQAGSPSGRFADVNGLKMYYEIHGSGGTPLVLLHGGGSTIDTTFGRILIPLSKTRRIIAIEQQGHGHTTDIAGRPFTFEQSADDTVALLGQLKVDQADFFGFSNGGNIALQIAIRHPKRVRKLVIASAMYKRDGVHPQVWEFMKHARLENMPQVLKDAYLKVAPHPEQLQVFHDKCAKRMLEFQDWRSEDIQSIAAHTLLIIGDSDSIRPEHALEMRRLLSGSQLAILPGGHGAYIGEASAVSVANSQVQFGAPESATRTSRIPELCVGMIVEFLDAPVPAARARNDR